MVRYAKDRSGLSDESGELPVARTEGQTAAFAALKATLEALSRGGFCGSILKLHHLFTYTPSMFIETYEDCGVTVYALRPGVSKLLNRIHYGVHRLGGGVEVHAAVNELVEFDLLFNPEIN